jgi:hypothetical protein
MQKILKNIALYYYLLTKKKKNDYSSRKFSERTNETTQKIDE